MAWVGASNRFSGAMNSPTQGGRSVPRTRSAAKEQEPSLFGPLLFHKQPTLAAAAIFLLALSGPPRLRIRDPESSLRGDMDWVVILHLVVWGAAGLWVLWKIAKRFQARRPLLRLSLPQILGLVMILGLAASAWVSDAPLFTAFKVYQMLVSLLVAQIFMGRIVGWTYFQGSVVV